MSDRDNLIERMWLGLVNPDAQHVMPEFGKPHISLPTCWCEPKQLEDEPLVWVHNPEN